MLNQSNTNTSKLIRTSQPNNYFSVNFSPVKRSKVFLIILVLIQLSSSCLAVSWDIPIRQTSVGIDNNNTYDASESAVAFNSLDNKYMIVWEGNEMRSGLATDEVEIFGHLFNADGSAITTESIRISFMGATLSNLYDARSPEIVFNPDLNEFLITWYGDDDKQGLVEGEFEIFAQRINASNGQLVGAVKRVSDMGPTSNRSYDAFNPHVSYNTHDKLYFVVWHGEEGNSPSPLGSFEIYGQLLNGQLNEVGTNDFIVSSSGPDGSVDYNAFSPVTAYNSNNNEFLVSWYGEDDRDGRVPGEFEIYAQRINAQTGVLIGSDSTAISFVGLNGDVARAAKYPDVSYNKSLNEYFIIWSADDSKDGHVGNEFEIYGQVVDANLGEKGKNDFLISEMGTIGLNSFDAFRPKLEYQQQTEQYVVVWRGDDGIDGEFEIYTQRLDASSLIRLGKRSERLSHAGVDDSIIYDARRVDIANNPNNGELIVVWEQEDETDTQTLGEFEVFSSRMKTSAYVIDKNVTGSWYDPNRNGEGFIIEVLPNDGALVVWFTYLPGQTEQAWFIGSGTRYKNRMVINDIKITSGGNFGPTFDANLVQRDVWGDVSFEFNECGIATINYESEILTYASGDHAINKLINISGLDCNNPGPSSDPLDGITGTWFDPTHNGEGWLLEYLGNQQMLMYWFTYDDVGNQKWIIAIGSIDENNVITYNNTTTTNGTTFGESFDAAAVNRTEWGFAEMIINDCNSITVNYDSVVQAYGQGSLDAIRITSVDDLPCSL